jgi:hypothetical protein
MPEEKRDPSDKMCQGMERWSRERRESAGEEAVPNDELSEPGEGLRDRSWAVGG